MSQKVTKKFKVTIRSCDTSLLINFNHRIRLFYPLGTAKSFLTVYSEGQVKVRYESQISNLINVNKTNVYQMQLELKNPIMPFNS